MPLGLRVRKSQGSREGGGSGPQPHPGFIEVFREVAVDVGHREVAGAGEDRARVTVLGRSVAAPHQALATIGSVTG